MEINSYNQLLSSPSPLLIKTRKLFPKLAGMAEVCLVPTSPCHSHFVCLQLYIHFSVPVWVSHHLGLFCLNVCVVSASLSLISCMYFPYLWHDIALFLSFSVHACVSLCCMQSHVANSGLKLWVITPIMNHHGLFRLSSPRGIDCIMKISFSLSNTLCPYITLFTNKALHKESDNHCIKLNLNI